MQINKLQNIQFGAIKYQVATINDVEDFFKGDNESQKMIPDDIKLTLALNALSAQSRAALALVEQRNMNQKPATIHEFYNGRHSVYEDYSEVS